MYETPQPGPSAGHTGSDSTSTLYRTIVVVLRATAVLLLLPLLAMQFTDEVVWGAADFAVAGALLFGAGLLFMLATRRTGSIAYRVAAGLAIAAALLLVWINLAVGIIGSEDDPANLMYLAVLVVGVLGALLARFQPLGMARAMFATALAQALVAVIAAVAGWGSPENGPVQILAINGLFVALFAGSALLFRHARRAP